SPCFNKLFDIEITGFIVFLASTNRADINSKVRWSLHLWLKIEKAPLVYGRGDTDIYTRFLRRRTKESDIAKFASPIIKALLSLSPPRTTYRALGLLSIFRDLSNIDEARVTFILYPQDLTKEETQEN
ncbi:uncharacterized protein N7500_001989, partial [Penicillium coprophilum]|uniref:uncharacterized protein n=1 Tax=Penicillium coprophilum TaxID=36646 RepID=UPI00239F0971